MYRKRCVICFVFVFSFQLVNCQIPVRNIEQVKRCFKKLDLKFINQRDFDKSRGVFFQRINKSCFESDTLILIESFTDETGSYSGSIYSSADPTIRCFYIRNKYGKHRVAYELIETTHCGISRYIVNSIQNDSLSTVFQMGVKQQFTPSALLIITIVKKTRKGYAAEFYKTNSFKIDQ